MFLFQILKSTLLATIFFLGGRDSKIKRFKFFKGKREENAVSQLWASLLLTKDL